ncbi:MAG: flagellar protein FlgN [Bdellovibrionaceae bacterium]|nr:flagellar protein FlgN [Bdellovibrionales bacterium]MCB9084878.1 flagellar protein FlgN [Pseudobdellovibrionaceae bacterium]
MKPTTKDAYDKLILNLEDQVKIYRSLLEVVRKEKDILISANLDDLTENNKAKEAMLLKLRGLESSRIRYVAELAVSEGMPTESPRLVDLAIHFGGEVEDRLRNLHSVLELLLKRVQEYNQQNEGLVNSALEKITGAMNAIRDTLTEKPTYEKKGQMADQGAQSGQLVSREA